MVATQAGARSASKGGEDTSPGYGQSSGEAGLRDMLDVTLHGLDVDFATRA